MRSPTAVTCEVVGGPRDGDLIVVPGETPPERLRVLLPLDHSRLYLYHPAAPGLPDMLEAEMYVLDLDYRPAQGHPTWRYLWPTNR